MTSNVDNGPELFLCCFGMRRILLVNPPIYDFAAYDFWLRPYGLLTVAGQVRGQAEFSLFDYLEHRPCDPPRDRWGRGRLYYERIESPEPLKHIPRYFRRFGAPRPLFTDYLAERGPFDYVLIQTMMTYWYPGVREVLEDIRRDLARGQDRSRWQLCDALPRSCAKSGGGYCRRRFRSAAVVGIP